jgi:7-cyano-7-deazaguanine reductase
MTSDPDSPVLGRKVSAPVDRLDILTVEVEVDSVEFTSAEVASMCPVTGQPDLSEVRITYRPAGGRIVESKSLKLYLWSFRDRGIFCEGLASEIADRFMQDASPHGVEVVVTQSVRGGIVTRATARRPSPPTG